MNKKHVHDLVALAKYFVLGSLPLLSISIGDENYEKSRKIYIVLAIFVVILLYFFWPITFAVNKADEQFIKSGELFNGDKITFYW